MKPADSMILNSATNWCLADNGKNYLVLALDVGRIDLKIPKESGNSFTLRLFNPRTGDLSLLNKEKATDGNLLSIKIPNKRCWVLWLCKSE